MGNALAITGAGLVVGAAGALILARALGSLLYEVSPADPIVFSSVAALMMATAVVACAVPAWRAARVDPLVALRTE